METKLDERIISPQASYSRSKADVRRILFAISPREYDLFYPNSPEISFPRSEIVWRYVADEPRSEWLTFLRDYQPQIVVSGWSTPQLPIPLTGQGGKPPYYICHLTGSVKGVVPRDLLVGGTIVSNWGSIISHTIAEHAILLVLAALRNLPRWAEVMHGQSWSQKRETLRTFSLKGKRVGIHGFGNIAREIARMLTVFDCEVAAFSSGVPDDVMRRSGVRPAASLEDLFSESQVIIECEALTEDTVGVVSNELLSLLPREAVFVNIGRGALVDEKALAEATRQGRIRLGTDVFQDEPLPPDSELHKLSGAILSPHIAGPTFDCLPKCGEFALSNIARYLNKQDVEAQVTLEAYDRST